MQLKKIKRAEKKGTESVMDEKFTLLFYTSVIVNDYRIRVIIHKIFACFCIILFSVCRLLSRVS